jgi:phospholipase C
MQTGMYVLPHFNELFGTPDPRFPTNLANGPFQLTKYVPYNVNPRNPIGTVTGDPPHRFFQMWQQTGGNNEQLDMFTWVAVTAGQGGGTSGVTSDNVGQGGELMSFLNMHNLPAVDAPYWKYLAGQYALSDNTHQSIMGGTGINFFAIATADLPYYVDGNGNVATPFDNQIENPNPEPGTPNFYIQDGYEGGSYVNCSDSSQAGVAPILDALAGKNIDSKCEPGKFYLVNNYGLGYDMHGNTLPVGEFNYTLPPQTVPTIAEALTNNGVSWKWYTGGRDIADVEPLAALFGIPVNAAQGLLYNAIGDPLVASQNVMTNPSLKAGLAGLTTFFNDVKTGNLPAVSFVVPMSLYSGHPGYSVQQLYESFLQNVVANVQAHPQMWADTAIILTTDEGGGYFDTGWIQNQDFFGDGPRIPMIVVSPHSRKNFIDHTYHNHVSILKFIQRNWKLDPLSPRSRDNHPIPVTTAADLYRPINTTPTIGDLMTMFDF